MTGAESSLGNFAKTAVLMAALVALLAIGGRFFGGANGMLVFGAIGLVINFLGYWFSDTLALMAHRARRVSVAEAPTLHRIVERLCERAGLPMPRLYIIPSQAPNAFATGRGPSHAAVAVTEGLLDLASERELAGVLAHELSHVKNRDILIATIAAGLAGIIATVGHVMQWGLMWGGARDDEGDGGGLAALAWIIVAPIIAMLIQLAVSRSREYGADASGARLTGDPDALADALAKLEATSRQRPYPWAGPATAHMFIVNPLRSGAGAAMLNLLSTHPPVEERIRRLRAMR